MNTYTVQTWQTDRGWSARETFFRVEAEGGETERDAVDAVVGSALIALGYREHPPRQVEFVVQQLGGPP